jgi:hypothetical protein
MSIRLMASLAVLLILAVVASPAEAAVAPSRGRSSARTVRGRVMNRVNRYLRRRAVARHLREKGMSAREVEDRLNLLNDDQLFEMAEQLDQIDSAKGHCEDVIVAVLVARILLIVIFLPFYLMWLMMCEAPCCGC